MSRTDFYCHFCLKICVICTYFLLYISQNALIFAHFDVLIIRTTAAAPLHLCLPPCNLQPFTLTGPLGLHSRYALPSRFVYPKCMWSISSVSPVAIVNYSHHLWQQLHGAWGRLGTLRLLLTPLFSSISLPFISPADIEPFLPAATLGKSAVGRSVSWCTVVSVQPYKIFYIHGILQIFGHLDSWW